MKLSLIAGVVLIVLGAFVLVRGLSYPSRQNVVKVGDFQASVQHDRAVPQWAGIAAIAAGALVIGVGLRGRKG
jgi:drug/metabolite transporter (DMT)-like permease